MTAMMTLQQAVAALGGKSTGNMDAGFAAVSTDTRNIKQGDLFVALRGPNFDGHEFIAHARESGAVGAIVDHVVDDALPQIVVDDTRLALGRLGAWWRSRFNGVVLGVTGSNGKTTVKEMIASILAANTERSQGDHTGTVLATEGNLNNDIGVPLMLLRLRPQHRFAVIEMGANHPGEIDYLSTLVQPDVALITNAAAVHLAGFGSTVEDVARAKGEIWMGLKESGTAVINADDTYAGYWRELVGERNTLTFGMTPDCDVALGDGGVQWALEHGCFRSRFVIQTAEHGSVEINMALAGRHNIRNALAATAAALAAGATLNDVQTGLNAMKPVKGRLQPKTAMGGQLLIDDSYNANPPSMNAAVDVLVQAPGQTIFVMGDMGELGEQAAALHYQVGERARQQGVTRLLATGPLCREAVRGFGGAAQWFETQDELIGAVNAMLAQSEYRDAAVLVKGSRSSRMERVVEALQGTGPC
jgi:UDP-N-acetylmuramoyl-tripeptide--D-alanyl-D-alanine ligase